MRNGIITLALIALLFTACEKDKTPDNTNSLNQTEDLAQSNLDFLNANWNLTLQGDSIKDPLIGVWLSDSVWINGNLGSGYDSIFTWVMESDGKMATRNNDWGDSETINGLWDYNCTNEAIMFQYKVYANGNDTSASYYTTDTIYIEHLSPDRLSINRFMNPSHSDQMEIHFIRYR